MGYNKISSNKNKPICFDYFWVEGIAMTPCILQGVLTIVMAPQNVFLKHVWLHVGSS